MHKSPPGPPLPRSKPGPPRRPSSPRPPKRSSAPLPAKRTSLPGPPENLVAAPPSADEVEATTPLNLVGTPARNDDVVTRGADDLVRPTRPHDRRLKAPAHRRSRRRARGRSEHHRCEHRYCEHDGSSACRSPLPAPLPHRKPLLVAAVTKSADPTAKFSFLQGPGAKRSGLVGLLVIDHGTGTERARRYALRYASFRRELMAGRGPRNWTLEVASLGKNSAAFAGGGRYSELVDAQGGAMSRGSRLMN